MSSSTGRPVRLGAGLPRADRSKGGRPPFDHVLMFKVLILQTQNSLSDERTEFYLRDRLTPPLSADSGPCRDGSRACCARWMRFLGLGLGDPVPDANTIWTFREALTRAGAIEPLFDLFDRQLRAAGYLATAGQLVDATIVAAPKQRTSKAEKQALKEGRIPEGWQEKPAKLRQKDRDARPRRSPDRRPCGNRVIRLLADDGPSSTPRPRCKRTAASPGSTSRSRCSGTRATSAPIAGIA